MYFPMLRRWGKAFLVSTNRRIHWKARRIDGKVEKKPRSREWEELQRVGSFQPAAYKQKNKAMFYIELVTLQTVKSLQMNRVDSHP